MIKKDFDVFIAYHGSYDKGTADISSRLNDFLLRNGIITFYFPTFKSDNYIANITKAVRSSTFLLVCNENINTTETGRLNIQKHYALSTEIEAFYASTRDENNIDFSDAKILVCGDYYEHKKVDASKLHELFSNRTHFILDKDENISFLKILDWIKERLECHYSNWHRSQISTEIDKVFTNRDEMVANLDLFNLIASSKNIKAVGISNVAIVEIAMGALRHSLDRNNAKVEVVFLDPESEFTKQRELDEFGVNKNIIKGLTTSAIGKMEFFKSELNEKIKENCKLFKYAKMPRFNLILLDNCAILQYYTDKLSGGKSPCFYVERQKNSSPLYEYCEKIYNDLIAISEEIL